MFVQRALAVVLAAVLSSRAHAACDGLAFECSAAYSNCVGNPAACTDMCAPRHPRVPACASLRLRLTERSRPPIPARASWAQLRAQRGSHLDYPVGDWHLLRVHTPVRAHTRAPAAPFSHAEPPVAERELPPPQPLVWPPLRARDRILDFNPLNGTLPTEVGNMTSLTHLCAPSAAPDTRHLLLAASPAHTALRACC